MIVLGFESRLNKRGEPRDWVHVAPNAIEATLCSTWARIKEFEPTQEDWDAPESNEHATVKKFRWEKIVKPHYDAWLKGNEIPEGGTPLSAWLELNKGQIDALKKAGIATVEMIAEMNESVMAAIPLPNKHALKAAAGEFLKAKDAQGTQAELEALRAELEALKTKRGPGRPRKDEAA